MQVFTDNKKRNWTVVINVATARRVKAMLEVDLMDALGGGLVKKLSADSGLLCNILYVLCEYEAEERGITDRKFGVALTGGCAVAAYCAFMAELVNFFPEGEKKKETENLRDGESENPEKSYTTDDIWNLVWQHAGVLGIDPGIFTLRELSLMAKAKKLEDWNRTSAILSQNHNMNRSSKNDPVRLPDDFNPYVEHVEEVALPVNKKTAFDIMKKVFIGNK